MSEINRDRRIFSPRFIAGVLTVTLATTSSLVIQKVESRHSAPTETTNTAPALLPDKPDNGHLGDNPFVNQQLPSSITITDSRTGKSMTVPETELVHANQIPTAPENVKK